MPAYIRTTSDNIDFISLVCQLDGELAEIDGGEHEFYARYNKIDKINHVVIAYNDDLPIACGALKPFGEEAMEVKRMFTLSAFRGKGIASQLLIELEEWAKEMNFSYCVLETGIRQPDAIRLYEKNSYRSIPNYGQYIGIANSRCFEKKLI